MGSILVKAWMMFFYKKQGKKINSTTLLAAAEDSRNDVLTTAAVLVAVLVEKLSGWQIDGIMGILVAVFILFSGAKLAKETLSPLLGEREPRRNWRSRLRRTSRKAPGPKLPHTYGAMQIFNIRH